MKWQIESFLVQLIEQVSLTGSEQQVLAFLEQTAHSQGFFTRRFPVVDDRYNLLISWAEEPNILLSTHCDTVPPYIAPRMENGRIYGRGACDAKGPLAAMWDALLQVPEELRPRVGLLVVVGEETDSIGAKTFAKSGYPAHYIINGEPTQNHLASAQKGVLMAELTASGKPVHSGYPEYGTSAIDLLLEQLELLQALNWGFSDVLGNATFNIGTLSGGEAANTLASEARAVICVRLVENAQSALDKLNANLLANVVQRTITASNPLHLFVPPLWPSKPVSFGSDAAHFSKAYPTLMLGPGTILDAHTPDESVGIRELYVASERYQDLVIQLALLEPTPVQQYAAAMKAI